MSMLRKLNRGFLLFIILVIVVAIYLIINGISHKEDKKEIIAICEEYIPKEVAYGMLPEQYREDGNSMPSEQVVNYIDQMKEDLTSYYANEINYENLIEYLEKNINSLSKGEYIVTKYEKTIKNIETITFNGDTARVSIVSNTTYHSEDIKSDDVQIDDYIVFQKINGKWKITSTTLSATNNFMNYNAYN